MTLTHSEALEKFIDNLKEKDRSPSTIIAYKKDIEQLFDFYKDEHSKVSDYKTKHIKVWIEHLIKEKKFTLKTVSRKINSYKTLFKFLHRENYIESDVAHPISHPTFKPKDPRILSSLEYKALRDTARNNERLYAMIEILLQTGMRIGELSRLKRDNVDLESSPATAKIQAYASNPERVIPLNKNAVEAIQEYLKVRPNTEKDQGYLFITKTGRQVLVRNIRTMINNAFEKSGIEDATVNDIRNTFIVYQLERGIPIERVAEIVGHQRLTSTEKYLNLIEDRKKKKSAKVIPL
ncbi:tyrosine-type recombinase/integrase [Candidatus Dojkabacteria bacterium]|nr:tyrosine-type recombinase/integrase [Candidatus Dojkabacteria bacterium]